MKVVKLRLHTAINRDDYSCFGECDLMILLQKYSVIFSRVHFVTFICIYNIMHQDAKSARLMAVCKRALKEIDKKKKKIYMS